MSAVKELESAAAAMAGGDAEPAPAPEAASEEPEEQMSDDKKDEEVAKKMARLKAENMVLKAAAARREEDEKVQKLAAEIAEGNELKARLIKTGRETPESIKLLSGLSLSQLRERVRLFEAAPSLSVINQRPQPPGVGSVTAGDQIVEVSQFEAERVHAYADKRASELKAAGISPRSYDEVLGRYVSHREQQLRGARTDDQVKRLGRRIEQGNVLLSRDGRLVSLATTPVKPIEEFGQSSQRALEEFRMNYNMALAAEPKVWAELLGDMMPSGSINKDTYPINLSATRYVKKTAQAPGAETALNFDISVTKDEFYAGEEVELRRLAGGDFAHVMSWGRRAERMARARVFLRNALVTAIL